MTLTATATQVVREARVSRYVTYTGTDVAANTDWSETVPAGKAWKLLGVSASLVTDANAANRLAVLTIDDGTTVVWSSPSPGAHVASKTVRYNTNDQKEFVDNTMSPGIGGWATPPSTLLLMPGYRIKVITTAIQATDNWGAPTFRVIEYDL